MSFGLNPEIEPQQGRGKLDVLVSSRWGTPTDTTGPNCSPDIFFSRLIGFFRATDVGFSTGVDLSATSERNFHGCPTSPFHLFPALPLEHHR